MLTSWYLSSSGKFFAKTVPYSIHELLVSKFLAQHSPPSFINTRSSPQEMVTIIVGPDGSEQTFVVHQSAISYHSPFFAAAFKSNFVEGQTQSMRLAEVEEKIFGLLVHWIYTGEIEGGHCVGLVPAEKLWLLAHWCMIPELQNAAILLIRDTIFTGVVTKTTLVGFRDLILLAYSSRFRALSGSSSPILCRLIRLKPLEKFWKLSGRTWCENCCWYCHGYCSTFENWGSKV